MNEIFKKDYYRMLGEEMPGGIGKWLNIFGRHNLRYMYFFRMAQRKPSLLTRVILLRMSRKFGLEISTAAQIGPGFYLGHPYNITVAEGSVLGRNVNIHKGVTIGRENRGKRIGAPVIGDNVYLGINATVVGNVHIGNDVMIASNAFVNFDVPDHSVVLGNPGVVCAKADATHSYINFRV